MQKKSLTNKITNCCTLPFSVMKFIVDNLTLNSEADRTFLISKLHQNGTLSIDAWKVWINSGTLETDSSLTKAEFLAWFDCDNQPSCGQLRLLIEGFKIGNYNPADEYGVGWTEIATFEDYNDKVLKKITSYVGGVGSMPAELSDNIGMYYSANGGFTIDRDLAADFSAIDKSIITDNLGNMFSIKAGKDGTIGHRNTAIGDGALKYDAAQDDNTAIGNGALSNRIDAGSKSVAVGSGALYNNEGDGNVGIGYDSVSQAKGSDNVGIGLSANNNVTNGTKNTAIGSGANVGGDYSYTVALGAGAIAEKTGQVIIGNDNFTELKFFGRIVAKDHGVYYGDFVKWNYFMAGAGRDDYSDNTDNTYGNVGIGHLALQNVNDSMMNTAIGHQALQKLTRGADHTAVGAGALQKQTDGVGCTAMGRLAMANSTIGTNNTGLGDTALEFNIDGNSNTSVGYSSGIKAGGSNNTFMGTFAGGHHLARNGPLCIFNNTIAIGAATLQYNETFHNNTIVGTYSAHSVQGADNATLGYETLRNATSTNRNTALGTGAGFWLQEGDDNIFIGFNSGRDGQIRTVSGSIVIGTSAYSTRNNEIVIGNGSETHLTISGVVFTKEKLIALLSLV